MRSAVGSIAIALLVIGGAAIAFGIGDGAQFGGPCLRVGVLMALVWLAHPQLRQMPPWLPIAAIALALVLAFRPKLFPIGLIIVVALWFLRPRRGKSR
ncbi:MAG: hypothetical protein IT427_03875 [Pirellulales bacterium]|nr:hypothetical protein [Pirellulales bacterium]